MTFAEANPLAVVPLRGRMTVAEYEAERERLRKLYGELNVEAAAKRDQALAVLFYRSGWTQEELAKKEGKSRQWIVQRTCFGRFLNFATAVANSESIPSNLTEYRFRGYWEQTEGDERDRFHAVAKLMRAEPVTAPRRPAIGGKIKDAFADGKWHGLAVIVAKIDADEDHVRETLDGMVKNQTYGCKAERKPVGTGLSYRIFKTDRTISSHELSEKLSPIIDGLKAEGRKSMATIAPAAVAVLAHKLEQLLEEWMG